MSHFSTVRVQIKQSEVLHETLLDLGYTIAQNTEVRGYQGQTAIADYVVRQSNGYDLGFRRVAEEYELVADFWGAQIDQKQFINRVTQKYAHKLLLKTTAEQGFNLEAEELMQDGTVRVVVGRWA